MWSKVKRSPICPSSMLTSFMTLIEHFMIPFCSFLAYSFGECNGTPLQYSCLENPMDRGAWWAAVHGVAKSQTWLSDFTFTFHCYALEKEMATHSSVLAWRILGTWEPGGLPSMGSHRIGHGWSDFAAAEAAPSLGNVRGKKKTQQTHWCVVLQVLTFLASVPISLCFSEFLVFLFYMSCPGFLA